MKKIFNLWTFNVFIFNVLFHQLTAQVSEVQSIKNLPFSIFITEDSFLDLDSIRKLDTVFKTSEIFERTTRPDETYWLRINFEDNLETLKAKEEWRLRTPFFDKAKLFYNKNGIIKFRVFGNLDSTENPSSFILRPEVEFRKEDLIDHKYLFIKAKVFSRYLKISQWKVGYRPGKSNGYLDQYYLGDDIKILVYDYLYLGACSIIFVIFLAIFAYSGKKQFIFYALYILASIIYLISPNLNNTDITQFYRTLFGYWVFIISQVFINLFYVVFVVYYLNTKETYKVLHKSMVFIVLLLLGIIVYNAVVFSLGHYQMHLHVLDFQRLVMTIWGLSAMIYLLKNAKDILAYFIVVGSFIYMAGALGYLFFENRYHMIIGSIIEILIFSLGLAFKIKLEYEEKLSLKKVVHEKENSALRAQMNPHFIFNALSSIQNLILNGDRRSALKYLSKFGNLTRKVLESSIETKVLLRDEIKLLNSYLELESLRFDGVFEYEISVSKDLDTNTTEIPFMIIQPFVENAIIHGLNKKKNGDKKLLISFRKNKGSVFCYIEDNGIGRIESSKLSNTLKKKNRSRGIEITEKRLKLIGKSDQEKNVIEIIDKYDENNNPAGTKVSIRIIESLNPLV